MKALPLPTGPDMGWPHSCFNTPQITHPVQLLGQLLLHMTRIVTVLAPCLVRGEMQAPTVRIFNTLS